MRSRKHLRCLCGNARPVDAERLRRLGLTRTGDPVADRIQDVAISLMEIKGLFDFARGTFIVFRDRGRGRGRGSWAERSGRLQSLERFEIVDELRYANVPVVSFGIFAAGVSRTFQSARDRRA